MKGLHGWTYLLFKYPPSFTVLLGISYMLVSHSITQLMTSEPGHSSEEPVPRLIPISMQPGLMEAQVSIGGTIRPDWRQAAHTTLWPSVPPQMAWEQSESPGEPGAEQRATVCPAHPSLEVVLSFCLGGKKWVWFKALYVHCSTWSR